MPLPPVPNRLVVKIRSNAVKERFCVSSTGLVAIPGTIPGFESLGETLQIAGVVELGASERGRPVYRLRLKEAMSRESLIEAVKGTAYQLSLDDPRRETVLVAVVEGVGGPTTGVVLQPPDITFAQLEDESPLHGALLHGSGRRWNSPFPKR